MNLCCCLPIIMYALRLERAGCHLVADGVLHWFNDFTERKRRLDSGERVVGTKSGARQKLYTTSSSNVTFAVCQTASLSLML